MSNEHVITKNAIENNGILYIYYDNEFKNIKIKLDQNERYIKTFRDIHLDITVVEILDKDKIYKDYFLENKVNIQNDRLINQEIYIPQYANSEELKNARGIINMNLLI